MNTNWNLPKSVIVGEQELKIRNDCDYRVVLDVIDAITDEELSDEERAECAMYIFYGFGDFVDVIEKPQEALNEMIKIINGGEENDENEQKQPKVMDWKHDFKNLTPPISRVLGYSVRDEKNYTHWYDFLGAYMEIGDCYFAQITSLRMKKMKGKKLDKSDIEFYNAHKKDVDLPITLEKSEMDWLSDDDW